MHAWLISAGTTYPHFVYIATVILACVEGPILSVFFGILLQQGYFNFYLVFTALMVGDLLGDIGWYWIGYNFGHRFISRFGKYLGLTEEKSIKVAEIFHKRKDLILIVSKITNGFGFSLVTLITAGMVKVPFRRYMILNGVGQFVWTGILIAAGYFFGNLYVIIEKGLGRLSAVGLVLLVAGVVVLGVRYIQQKFADRIKN